MRWMIAVIGVILVVAAAAGGLAYSTHSRITRDVDEVVARIAPFADVRYAGVTITPRGLIRIRDIEIRPRAVNDAARLEAVELETPGIWFILSGGWKRLREGQLPERLRMTVRGLSVDLDGPLATTVDRLLLAAARSSSTPPASNCGEIRYFDLSAYRRLGYAALVLDLSLGYRFEPGHGPLRVTLDGHTRDLGATTVNLEFAGVSPNLRENIGRPTALNTFEIVYQDRSFTNRVKRYCTRASGLSVQQYIDAEVARTAAASEAQWGLALGPGLRQAYRDFLTTPGEIRVHGTVSAGLDMTRLGTIDPAQLVSKLNLRVSVNGSPVKDLSATPTRAAAPPPERVAEAPSLPAPAPPPVAPAAVARSFQTVAPAALAGHLDKTVRLHLTDGTTREGQLRQVAGGRAHVERRERGGVITHGIPLREIDRVEVRF